MNRFLWLIILAAITTRPALANVDYIFSGNACIASNPEKLENELQWDSRGIVATGNGFDSAYVYCPIGGRRSTAADISETVVRFRDNNDNTGWGGSLNCRLQVTTATGSTYSTSVKYSCSTVGGCNDPNGIAPFAGYNQLSFGDQLVNISSAWTYSIYCFIPFNDYAGVSSILGYSVTQVSP